MRQTPRVDPRPAASTGPAKLRAGIRWTLCALGLLYFPAAFFGSLWLIPLVGAVVGVAWLFTDGWTIFRKELAVLLLILFVYSGASALGCWTGIGFCIGWLHAQEVYVLAAGLLLYVCGIAAAGRTGRGATVVHGAALGSFVTAALIVLATRDHLAVEIRPQFPPLLIERNDLAPLVAWMFFVYGLLRSAAEGKLTRYFAYPSVLVVAGLLSLATQSRLVAMISVLGAIAFAPIDRRSGWLWAMIGIAVACLLAVEHQQLEQLVRRVLLAEGGPSVATRFFLWSAGWKMFVAAPWFGHGLGGFSELAETYARPLPIGADLDVRVISWPHNVPIEILVEKGIAGLAAFLSLLVLGVRNLTLRPRHVPDGGWRATAYLLVALILIGLLDSTTKRLWYLPSLLYAVGMSAGLTRSRGSPVDPANLARTS